jgi:hypothetical protein
MGSEPKVSVMTRVHAKTALRRMAVPGETFGPAPLLTPRPFGPNQKSESGDGEPIIPRPASALKACHVWRIMARVRGKNLMREATV